MIFLEIFDANWIANILSISFTLVVFLLGIPIVFLQTYVPEDLRKYSGHLQVKQKSELGELALLLVPVILFFGNYAFKEFLIKFIPEVKILCIKIDILLIYYFVTLAYFVFLSRKIYKIFLRSVFREENIKENIIKEVFVNINKSVSDYYFHVSKDNYKLLEKNYIKSKDDLKELSEIFSQGVDKTHFLNETYAVVNNILKDKMYKGEGVKDIFEEILYPIFIKETNSCSYREIDECIDVCKNIGEKYKANIKFASFDSSYIIEPFLFELCIKLIESENISLVKKIIYVIKIFNGPQSVFFKIHFHAFEKNIYSLLIEEVTEMIKVIIKDVVQKEDITPLKNNLVAYLAMLNSRGENLIMKKYVKDKLTYLHNLNKTLEIIDFENSLKEFVRTSKFDTAQKILNLKNELFIPFNNMKNTLSK